MIDVRRAVRHRIAVPVDFEQTRCLTRDLSVSGVCLEDVPLVTPGKAVEFVIHLTSLRELGFSLRCSGTVVRVENSEGTPRVAATIEEIQFAAIQTALGEETGH
jgi:hypothetical protein